MKKSNQIILAALGAVFIFSIAFQLKVNRYLRSSEPNNERMSSISISEERAVTNFNRISVRDGIEVYFTQDSITSIKVEAQDNSISLVRTEIENGELLIRQNKKTTNRDTIKVFVSNKELDAVNASSGAYFETLGEVEGNNLVLEFSSDTRGNLELSYASVICKAASGSQVKFRGNTSNIEFTN